MNKIRLDVFLSKLNNVKSRNVAIYLINNNLIKVNGVIIDKKNYLVSENDVIEIIENEKYVSRAAYKLLKALEVFDINVESKNAIDIGSSTGGFSQVLLEHKINFLYCIDVGSNQLDKLIRENKNVKVYENTNFKDVDLTYFDKEINLIVCDVSFISIQKILDKIIQIFKNPIELIVLFKPQYECGPKYVKNGFVKIDLHKKLIEKFNQFCLNKKIKIINQIQSPISGAKKHNIEYLFHLRINYEK